MGREFERVLGKGWKAEVSKDPRKTWDLVLAPNREELQKQNGFASVGFHENLDDAVLDCEKGILSRWDEMYPHLDKSKYQ